MDPDERVQSDRIQALVERTRLADEQGIGATRAGCRCALQNCDWDVDAAERMLQQRPWMLSMQPTGQPPTLTNGE